MKISPWLMLALSLIAQSARGQAGASNANAEARRHFQEGLQSAQQGDLRKALQEFEAAYAAQPNFSVLYNIGQAQSALGRPVEASAAFERYLAESGNQITTSRRDEVTATLAANRKRIGQIRLVVDTKSTIGVWIDGSPLARGQWDAPFSLAVGPHSILHAERDCAPVAQDVIVAVGDTVTVPLAQANDCAKALAHLQVECSVPDVEVDVGGVIQARTPIDAPLSVPVGEVTVTFKRAGYASVSRSVRTTRDKIIRIKCEQRIVDRLPPPLAAGLIVHKIPADASVAVDGEPFRGGILPAGLHEVSVEREGFLATRRLVSLEAGKATSVSATLAPTAEGLAREQRNTRRRRTRSLLLGGSGVALLGTGAGLYGWNSGRYDDWKARSAGMSAASNLERATSIQRVDDLSLALTVLGAGLATAGVWLFFTAD
jgi:hypothetical protein